MIPQLLIATGLATVGYAVYKSRPVSPGPGETFTFLVERPKPPSGMTSNETEFNEAKNAKASLDASIWTVTDIALKPESGPLYRFHVTATYKGPAGRTFPGLKRV